MERMKTNRILIVGIIVLLIGVALIAVFKDNKVAGKVYIFLQDAETGEYVKAKELACKISSKDLSYEPQEKAYYEIDTERSLLKVKDSKNVVFAVYYKCRIVTVTFSGEGGDLVSGEETLRLRAGQKFDKPVYKKEGYELIGFKIKDSTLDVPSSDNYVMKDTDFVAIWKAVEPKQDNKTEQE